MPDLWDTNPDNVFREPDDQSSPAPAGRDDHTRRCCSRTTAVASGHLRTC